MPKISVVVPVYNTAQYLPACLDSIINQSLSDIEIICVDDGSTDNSVQILAEYAARDNRIKIISQKNSGVVVARNNGICSCTSELVYPLDSDDIIAPTALQDMYDVISRTDFRVVGCECQTFGKKISFFVQPKCSRYHMYGLHENCIVSALFYKKDFLDFGMYKTAFNGLGGDDMDYWLNYMDKDMPMYRIPKILFFYRTKEDCESVWKNYAENEFVARHYQKEKLLRKYHPRIPRWAFLYFLTHCKIARFFFRCPINDDGTQTFKIFKIPVYTQKPKYKLVDANTIYSGCAPN